MSNGALGATFELIGHPVSHSLSPAIHHAAYDELGLPGLRYVAVDCPDAAAVRVEFDALRQGNVAGANVTVPWKRLAIELSDEVDESARSTGAANVICPRAINGTRRLVAHNTDVPALAQELALGRQGARTAVVIGSGGAALAAVAACRMLGMARVSVVARRFGGDSRTDRALAGEFSALGADPLPWPGQRADGSAWRVAASGADVVVQTTSDGMQGATDGSAVRAIVPWAELGASTFVYDVVYNPAVTPFVEAARARGLRAETGLGMLVGQAALAVELWLGKKPPLGPLRAAAERALAEKQRR